MFGPQVLDRTSRLLRAQNRLAAQVARTVREGELTQAAEHDGQKTMQSWLRGHARLSRGRRAPAGRARGGRWNTCPQWPPRSPTARSPPSRSRVIAPVSREEHRAAADAQGVDLAAVDAMLAEVAATRPHARAGAGGAPLPGPARPRRPRTRPDGGALAVDRQARRRQAVVRRWSSTRWVGRRSQAVLESIAAGQPARRAIYAPDAQQLGDAFVQWADNTLAAGDLPILRTVKPHVVVTIGIDDLADPATGHGAAQTGFGARISAARARWLACDGNVSRLVIGPDGQPLDLGRDHAGRAPAPPPGHRDPATGTACSPAATPPPTGATSTTSCEWVPTTDPTCRRERRAALRTAPHEGPPRLPGRTTTRRPMAHLPPRRHRDPPASRTCPPPEHARGSERTEGCPSRWEKQPSACGDQCPVSGAGPPACPTAARSTSEPRHRPPGPAGRPRRPA